MIWVEKARFSKNLFGNSIFTGTIIMSPLSTDIVAFPLENHLLELPEITIPLVLIESVIFDNTNLKKDNKTIFGTMSFIKDQNKALNDIYSSKSKKYKNLFYIKGENLIGNDHEATIDGIHFNDLGHFRAYEKIKLQIEKIIDP